MQNEYTSFLNHETISPSKDSYPHQLFCPLQNYELQDNYIQTLFVQPSECYYHPCYVEDGSDTPAERVTTPTKTKKRKSKSARSLQKLSVTNSSLKNLAEKYEKQAEKTLMEPDRQTICAKTQSVTDKESSVKDDSSWCDLTDTSQTSVNIMGSGDNKKSPPKVQDKVKQFDGISNTLEQPQMPETRKYCFHFNIS